MQCKIISTEKEVVVETTKILSSLLILAALRIDQTMEVELRINKARQWYSSTPHIWSLICNSTFRNNQFLPQSCKYPGQKNLIVRGWATLLKLLREQITTWCSHIPEQPRFQRNKQSCTNKGGRRRKTEQQEVRQLKIDAAMYDGWNGWGSMPLAAAAVLLSTLRRQLWYISWEPR